MRARRDSRLHGGVAPAASLHALAVDTRGTLGARAVLAGVVDVEDVKGVNVAGDVAVAQTSQVQKVSVKGLFVWMYAYAYTHTHIYIYHHPPSLARGKGREGGGEGEGGDELTLAASGRC